MYMVTNFLAKVAQILCDILGYFKKRDSLRKMAVATSAVIFGAFWATFCHTHHLKVASLVILMQVLKSSCTISVTGKNRQMCTKVAQK